MTHQWWRRRCLKMISVASSDSGDDASNELHRYRRRCALDQKPSSSGSRLVASVELVAVTKVIVSSNGV